MFVCKMYLCGGGEVLLLIVILARLEIVQMLNIIIIAVNNSSEENTHCQLRQVVISYQLFFCLYISLVLAFYLLVCIISDA